MVLASGDMRGTFDAAQKLAVAEMIQFNHEMHERHESFSKEQKLTEDEFSDEYSDVDEEAEAKARIAAPVEQMRERVPHDPADTAQDS